MNIDRIDESHKVLWPMFVNHCRNAGIGDADNDAWDDIKYQWEVFISGATAMFILVQQKKVVP